LGRAAEIAPPSIVRKTIVPASSVNIQFGSLPRAVQGVVIAGGAEAAAKGVAHGAIRLALAIAAIMRIGRMRIVPRKRIKIEARSAKGSCTRLRRLIQIDEVERPAPTASKC
jgi:hypothetical protein